MIHNKFQARNQQILRLSFNDQGEHKKLKDGFRDTANIWFFVVSKLKPRHTKHIEHMSTIIIQMTQLRQNYINA